MKKAILKKYAQLIVKAGVNVQPGQEVWVTAEIDQEKLVKYVVEAAYQAGARLVRVEWNSDPVKKLHYKYASVEELSKIRPWEKAKLKQRAKDPPCMIYIESNDPDSLKGVDAGKMSQIRQKQYPIIKPFRDQMENRYQWVIVAAPSKKWAKKIFPDERPDVAVEKLWQMILRCVHIGDGDEESALKSDPIAAWEAHNRNFVKRCKWLNDQHFEYLRYKSSNGTDFQVGLIPTAKWMGGGEDTLQGIYYNPNMPTEEIFISPMRGKAEGTLVATKPLSYQGQLIEDFSITFKDGRAVSCQARKGEELLKQIIGMDEGSAYLGEVALVPKESPINQSGVLFYNTLFDENACCHVALGFGFNNVLENFENMSLEEIRKAGVNDSMIHVDFMIGSDDLEIVGCRKDQKEVTVFKNGTWAKK